MTVLVDTSVLIDYLRGHDDAAELLERERRMAPLHASELTRVGDPRRDGVDLISVSWPSGPVSWAAA